MLIEWKGQFYVYLPNGETYISAPGDNIDLSKYARVTFIVECMNLRGANTFDFVVKSAPEDTVPEPLWDTVATIAVAAGAIPHFYGKAVVERAGTPEMSRVFRWELENTQAGAASYSDFRFMILVQDADCSCGG